MTEEKLNEFENIWDLGLRKQLQQVMQTSSTLIDKEFAQFVIDAVVTKFCNEKLNILYEKV